MLLDQVFWEVGSLVQGPRAHTALGVVSWATIGSVCNPWIDWTLGFLVYKLGL